MKNSEKIIIVMTMDDNYIYQTKVTIWSLLNNADKTVFYEINILCSSDLKEESRNCLNDLKAEYENFEIIFREIDTELFFSACPKSYVPIASYYRLVIDKILPDVDKCLFLDGDMIINSDLKDLYQTQMGENYIAGVPDSRIQCSMEQYGDYCKVIDIPTMKYYINAGVMILNLKKWRENNLSEEFMGYLDKNYSMMDQDILNKCCFGKIKFLDLQYNLFSDYYKNSNCLFPTVFSAAEVEEASRTFHILHYAGMYKPWNNARMRNGRIWWEYAQKALKPENFNELYSVSSKWCEERDCSYIVNRCKTEKKIVVFGFSYIGKDLVEALQRSGIENIVYFCDNSPEKQHQNFKGIEVLPVKEIIGLEQDFFWINTSQRYREEINMQLKNEGIPKERIFNYYLKSETYYKFVGDEYKDLEAEQKVIWENGIQIKNEQALYSKKVLEMKKELFDKFLA